MLKRIISPATFGLIIICFFLPWVNVSCQNYNIARISGIQFVTGTTLDQPKLFEQQFGMQNIPSTKPAKGEKLKPQLYAIIAFISAIVGIIVSFIKGKVGALLASISGGIGFIFVILQKYKLEHELVQKSQGLIQLDYLFGFYLTLTLFIFAIAVNIYFLFEKGYVPSRSSKEISELQYKFCPECGTKNEHSNVFCKECGKKFPQ